VRKLSSGLNGYELCILCLLLLWLSATTTLSFKRMTSMSHSDLLPIEIWERVIDHVAQSAAIPAPDERPPLDATAQIKSEWRLRNSSLAQCSLVCSAWRNRCRFHLSFQFYLRSRQDFASVLQFLSSSSPYTAQVRVLCICPPTASEAPTEAPWVSSVPLLLPALPNLDHLVLHQIDLTQQHPSFYMACRRLSFITRPRLLELGWLSFRHFSQIARLVLAVQTTNVVLGLRETPDRVHMLVDTACIANPWLAKIQINVVSAELLKKTPWGWIQACPNLSLLRIQINTVANISQGALIPDDWLRLCAVYRQMRTWNDLTMSLVSGRNPSINIFKDNASRLELIYRSDSKEEPIPTTISQHITLLSSCRFRVICVYIDSQLDWHWDDHTPKTWEAVDKAVITALGRQHDDVLHPCIFFVSFPEPLPRQYGCYCEFVRSLVPRTAALKIAQVRCWPEACSLHHLGMIRITSASDRASSASVVRPQVQQIQQ